MGSVSPPHTNAIRLQIDIMQLICQDCLHCTSTPYRLVAYKAKWSCNRFSLQNFMQMRSCNLISTQWNLVCIAIALVCGGLMIARSLSWPIHWLNVTNSVQFNFIYVTKTHHAHASHHLLHLLPARTWGTMWHLRSACIQGSGCAVHVNVNTIYKSLAMPWSFDVLLASKVYSVHDRKWCVGVCGRGGGILSIIIHVITNYQESESENCMMNIKILFSYPDLSLILLWGCNIKLCNQLQNWSSANHKSCFIISLM